MTSYCIILSAPTSVKELTLHVTVSATEITVSWMAPMMPNGVIIGYNVTLSGINLANSEAITISGSSVVINETSYTVNHTSIPYSNYTAVVFASTNVGPGPMTTVTEQTPEDGEFGWMPEITIIYVFTLYTYIRNTPTVCIYGYSCCTCTFYLLYTISLFPLPPTHTQYCSPRCCARSDVYVHH